MTSFRIEEIAFSDDEISALASLDPKFSNWPVVYTLSNARKLYVGESLNVAGRLKQHAKARRADRLHGARVVLGDNFHKSACLDLESFLIRLFAGDGKFEVINRNHGITDADYFGRETYQSTFEEVFEELRSRGAFTRTLREIENTDLFKLSPFKALTQDQAIAVEDILTGLFDDLETARPSTIVIQGAPGTGKTVVAIFLMKLLSDIRGADIDAPPESDSLLSEFFVAGYPELLQDFQVGLVIPQQSLRTSVQGVFRKTPGLHPSQVLSPFQVGESRQQFDLLIVDEAHRLNQRANQASGPLNLKFRDINVKLFGKDDHRHTQLDWINAKSSHQIYLLDSAQAVRPSDLPLTTTTALVESVRATNRLYPLTSQMRVAAGDDYVGYVRGVLDDTVAASRDFDGYDLRFFEDLKLMRAEIKARDDDVGLARLLAGFAWRWQSKGKRSATDISIDGLHLQWNATQVDWVSSPGSVEQVGSIHTIQGYDLNYAGVIIGGDLRYDPVRRQITFERSNYFDPRGMANNKMLGVTYTDDDILQFVRNVYAVLLTRGMLGTYVYVVDRALREHLRPFFQASASHDPCVG